MYKSSRSAPDRSALSISMRLGHRCLASNYVQPLRERIRCLGTQRACRECAPHAKYPLVGSIYVQNLAKLFRDTACCARALRIPQLLLHVTHSTWASHFLLDNNVQNLARGLSADSTACGNSAALDNRFAHLAQSKRAILRNNLCFFSLEYAFDPLAVGHLAQHRPLCHCVLQI